MRRALGAAALAGAAWSLPALAPLAPHRAEGLDGLALTFDDGPHPKGTPAVLELLARAGVRATFFLVGEQVRARPALAAEIAAAGHALGVHGDRHRVLLRVPPAAARADLDRAAAAIGEAAGVAPVLHRPPLGIYAWPALRDVRRRGWRPVLWSRWGRDWSAAETPDAVAARVTRDLRAGDVLLLHDADWYSDRGSWRTTVAALPRILDTVAASGLAPRALGA